MSIPFRYPNHGRITREALLQRYRSVQNPAHDAFFGDLLPDWPDVVPTSEEVEALLYFGDIKFGFDSGVGGFSFLQNDIERDGGLETAVILSLFTDARALNTDILPDSSKNRRGWWGDIVSTDSIGSKQWLYFRDKSNSGLIEKIRQANADALAWMIQDGVAKSISVQVTAVQEELQISVAILRPDNGEAVNFRYFYNWETQKVRRG